MSKTILIGESCVDKTTYCTHKRMSPEDSSVPVYVIKNEESTEGMAQIVAKYFHILGMESEFLTDIFSNIIKNRIVMDGKQICRIDEDNTSNLSTFQIDHFIQCNYNNIVISDYGKGLLTNYIVDIINDKAKRGSKVYLDPHPDNNIWKYHNVFMLKLNQKEVTTFTGLTDYALGAHVLRSKMNVEHVFVTLGSGGIYYLGPSNTSYTVPSKAVCLKRLSGAGDVVFASLVHSIESGKAIKPAMEDAMELVKNYIEEV